MPLYMQRELDKKRFWNYLFTSRYLLYFLVYICSCVKKALRASSKFIYYLQNAFDKKKTTRSFLFNFPLLHTAVKKTANVKYTRKLRRYDKYFLTSYKSIALTYNIVKNSNPRAFLELTIFTLPRVHTPALIIAHCDCKSKIIRV